MSERIDALKKYLQPGNHVHLVGIGGVSMRPLGCDISFIRNS